MRIEAVTFDGDGTLWDIWSAARIALGEVARLVSERYNVSIVVAELERARERIAQSDIGASMEQLRRDSFEEALASLGVEDREGINELLVYFLKRRRALTRRYPEVLDVLAALRGTCKLGLISNGNTLPEDVGLAHAFTYCHLSQEVGVWKPDPDAFRLTAAALKVPIETMLHVGDSPQEDYQGAIQAGCQAVLLCRKHDERKSCFHTVPHVTSLRGIVSLVERTASPAP